jgi:small-conductance mechanosensitive channel
MESNFNSDILLQTAQDLLSDALGVGGLLLKVLLFVLIARYAAKFAGYLMEKVLNVIKFENLASKFNVDNLLEKANVPLSASQVIVKMVYYLVLLLFVRVIADILNLTAISDLFHQFFNFIPQLLVSVIIFIVGTYIATFVRDIIAATTKSLGIGAGRLISSFVFYFLIVIVTLTALEQIGVDTTILTSNVVLFMGAILLAASVSYGFASREILANLLASFFSRKTFTEGQIIRIDDIEGEIIKIDSISLTIQTKNDLVVVPTHELITNRIHIIEHKNNNELQNN